jgi:hypothetical protein
MKYNLSLVEPIALGDGSPVFRAGPGTYYDKNGVLQTAAADVQRITSDPADLSAAPYALIELAATNALHVNAMTGAAAGTPGTLPGTWALITGVNGVTRSVVGVGVENGIEYIDFGFSGTATGVAYFFINTDAATGAAAGQTWVASAFVKKVSGAAPSFAFQMIASGRTAGGAPIDEPTPTEIATGAPGALSASRITSTVNLTSPLVAGVLQFFTVAFAAGETADLVLRVGLPQLERNAASSPIRTTGAPVTRPADALGPNLGLIYSSLTENDTDDAPLYNPATSYPLGAKVRRAETHRVYESAIAGNLGNTPELNSAGIAAKWIDAAPTNRGAMFDGDVSTPSSAANVLTVVLRPGAFSALYGAGIDADQAQVCIQDAPGGNIIYRTTIALEASQPGDYDEYFWGRFMPQPDFLLTDLDPYHQGIVTVTLTKAAGTVKCGVLIAGEQIPIGASQRGAKAKPKSYSTLKTDDFGNTSIRRRRKGKDLSVTAWVTRADASWVEGVIERLLDVPVVVVVSADASDYGLRCYGLVSGELSWDYPQDCLLTLSVLGLINATIDTTA